MSKTWSQKIKIVKVKVMKIMISSFENSRNSLGTKNKLQNTRRKVKKDQTSFQLAFDAERKGTGSQNVCRIK